MTWRTIMGPSLRAAVLAAAGLILLGGCGEGERATPGADSAADTAPAGDAGDAQGSHDAPVDTGPWQPQCPGGIGCPCPAGPGACDAPLCLETPDGPRCSDWCGDGACPPGWRCQGQKGGRDVTYFCIPDAGLLCRPCTQDIECQAAGHAGARCVAYGTTGGFCGLLCASDVDCPVEASCREVPSHQTGALTKQCVQRAPPGSPSGALGACSCSPHAQAVSLETTCWVEADSRTSAKRCLGTRQCGPAGLSACVALQGSQSKCLELQCLDPATGAPLANGTPCNDGRGCTVGDVCNAGVCSPGEQKCPCEPGFLECAGQQGATNQCKGPLTCEPAAAGADLPFACLPNQALAVDCDDSLDDPCLRNACLPLSGTCTMTASERTVEVCDTPAGADGKPGCRREVKASNLPDNPPAPCDDGLACSVGEACAKGGCVTADKSACECLQDADCPDDVNLCNGTPYCDKGDGKGPWTCKVNPASVKVCDTSGDSGCLQTKCVTTTGACASGPVATGTACSDGVACTVGDVCDGQGACDPGTWTCCKADADCAKEEDGDLCNGTLFCNKAAGACQLNPATVVSCPSVDDGVCAKAACVPATGACAPQAASAGTPCDDGDPCTDGDACGQGLCQPGTDTCSCASDADCKAKDDGDLCNGTLYCNKAIGKCKLNPATAITCPTVDDTSCRKNTCQPATGACKAIDLPAKVTCDADGTGCTQNDACDGQGTCAAGTAVCVCQADADCAGFEDGDLCNGTLYCDKSGAAPVCRLNPKTVKGCPSVEDTACQKNTCQAKTGTCAMTALVAGAPCSDGQPCTGGDGCDGKGACKAGGVGLCGCKAAADCGVFDDGDACNGAFACAAGGCVFVAKPPICDDGNACTQEGCEAQVGCKTTPLKANSPCASDGIECTFDGCDGAGACKHALVGCYIANTCHPPGPSTLTPCQTCKSGQTIWTLTNAPCNDGDACTTGDQCQAGTCAKGAAVDCDDKSACTTDSCAKATGCSHDAGPHEGLACATVANGQCVKGKCISVKPKVVELAAAGSRTCSRDVAGDVWCWGAGAAETEQRTVTPEGGWGRPVKVPLLSPAVALAVTNYAICVARKDGWMSCWGHASYGETASGPGWGSGKPSHTHKPADAKFEGVNLLALTGWNASLCGLDSFGVLRCWGGNHNLNFGETTNNLNEFNPVVVQAGTLYAAVGLGGGWGCGLTKGGVVRCWGHEGVVKAGGGGAYLPPQEVTWSLSSGAEKPTALSTGTGVACAITGTAKRLHCWGDNAHGVAQPAGNKGVVAPALLLAAGGQYLEGVDQVTVGAEHACARIAGAVWCWGRNTRGQMGNGKVDEALHSPTQVAGLQGVVTLAAGDHHTCAARGDGEVLCWGDDTGGLGGGAVRALALTPEAVPLPGGMTITDIALGPANGALISADSKLWLWGANASGQLGTGKVDALSSLPMPSAAFGVPKQVAFSGATTCVLAPDGKIRCAGANASGAAGQTASDVPITSPALTNAPASSHLAGGGGVFCAIEQTKNEAGCWGEGHANANGGAKSSSWKPIDKTAGAVAIAVHQQGRSACVAVADGSARCWGKNVEGDLGDGSSTSAVAYSSSVKVSLPAGAVASLLAIGTSACAAEAGKAASLVCWGGNWHGEVSAAGAGQPSKEILTPIASAFLSAVHGVAGAYAATCARTDGAVWCWGSSGNGVAGGPQAIVAAAPAPRQVLGIADAQLLRTGPYSACALRGKAADGGDRTLWCWGDNGSGQFGRARWVATPTLVAAPALCGNGAREDLELCDDGNVKGGDGCSATCQLEPPPL